MKTFIYISITKLFISNKVTIKKYVNINKCVLFNTNKYIYI